MSTCDFANEPYELKPPALDGLRASVEKGMLCVEGSCPRCTHYIHYVIELQPYDGTPPDPGGGGPAAKTAAPAKGMVESLGYVERLDYVEPSKALANERRFAVQCKCGYAHQGDKAGKGGCGAWLSLDAMWDEDGPAQLSAGPLLSLFEELAAEARDALAASELKRVQAAAANWKNGLAAIVALVPTLVVVKGTDTVDKLSGSDKRLVGILVVIGGVCAVVAALLALRGAYGPLARGKPTRSDDLTEPTANEVDVVISALRWTRGLTVVSVCALASAIGYAWAAPTATPANLSVTLSNKSAYCGTLVSSDTRSVELKLSDGRTEAIPLPRIAKTAFVSSC